MSGTGKKFNENEILTMASRFNDRTYLYVFNFPALKVSLDFTLLDKAWFIDLSNCNKTLTAKAGVICPY